jgi:ectoine hydroxylase-related dioxygenase (phytanoyl-CoA dioxygenase family)
MLGQFDHAGFVITPPLLSAAECDAIIVQLGDIGETTGAGTRRLLSVPWCAALAHKIRQCADLVDMIPSNYLVVQCTYFEKSPTKNWLVAWHQDLSIPVATYVQHPALSGWSEKEGQLTVQPPADMLATLLAVRVHLDECRAENGALRVVPQSHIQGRLNAGSIKRLRTQQGETVCAVSRGGGLVFRPLLLHASSKVFS